MNLVLLEAAEELQETGSWNTKNILCGNVATDSQIDLDWEKVKAPSLCLQEFPVIHNP